MTMSSPHLTDDRLRQVLEACRFHSTATSLRGARQLAPGSAVVLQFGDRVAESELGRPRLIIQCSLRINGEESYIDGATKWQIEKSCPWSGEDEAFDLVLEADLLVGRNIQLADVVTYGVDAYRHLRLMIADAHDTLAGLAVDRGLLQVAGPAMRIEARQHRDLIAGRSGLAASGRSRVSPRYLRMAHAACRWLADTVLPDLACAVRTMAMQTNMVPTHGCRGEGLIEGLSDEICVVGSVSLMPAHEPVQ